MDIDPALVTERLRRQVERVRVEPDPPADFVSFWQQTLDELNAIPLDLEVTLREGTEPAEEGLLVGEWRATSWGGRRIGGPLVMPADRRGPQWVYGHGYGSVRAGCERRPQLARLGFIALGCDARGYNRSRQPGDPAVPGWILAGIESRERYILRGAVADTIRAVQVARALEGADPRRTVLEGGSFSGGTAVLAAPWIADLAYLAVRVPTFGAYDLRRTLVKRGSGAEINAYMDGLDEADRRALRERLRYFDAVNAAAHIDGIPVTVGLGVSDAVVPGETVAAIYHAIPSPQKELLSFPCSHTDHPLAAQWSRFTEHIQRRALALLAARDPARPDQRRA